MSVCGAMQIRQFGPNQMRAQLRLTRPQNFATAKVRLRTRLHYKETYGCRCNLELKVPG
jgi:hypothetical protein